MDWLHGYRAEHLAQVCTKPILILCYNNTLASKLRDVMSTNGLDAKVLVQTFHSWCSSQLRAYNVSFPKHHGNDNDFFSGMVNTLIRAVDNKQVPSGQYDAVLIDEGHDFRPEWLKLVVQMVDPQSNSLLVLYDDAQSITNIPRSRNSALRVLGFRRKAERQF
ncbi:AAA family ATPase [Candidatus Nitrotoga arctica]|uniref:DNA helicase n=1 Tax=Candidatus Nitrotoga arctica TaxID=453162 RepID=A0ABM8YZZ9_9PROT|nr:AAA family ATPase [Candidatus Nitrotoga arctica]CAG9933150.1 protein of unknown function [Candidatus Nitrotoga arctica]